MKIYVRNDKGDEDPVLWVTIDGLGTQETVYLPEGTGTFVEVVGEPEYFVAPPEQLDGTGQVSQGVEEETAPASEPAGEVNEQGFPTAEDGAPIYSRDILPGDGKAPGGNHWAEFAKTQNTRALRIEGPFLVTTIHGGSPQRCEDGWLALDSEGYPYPIDNEVFTTTFVPARPEEASAEE